MDSEDYIEFIIGGITYKFRKDAYYSADGLWVAVDGDLARVGVGDHLYHSISPGLNLIELRPPGTVVRQGEEMGNFDMVKVDMPIPSPVSGIIEEINEELESNPWLLDSDAYGAGWLAVFNLTDFDTDRQNLLDVDAYRTMLEARYESAKPILFVSLGNPGLSQMAEAFFDAMSQGRWRCLSADTVPTSSIDPEVVRAMREAGIRVGTQQSELLTQDILDRARRIIAMGCSAEDLHLDVPVPVESWKLQEPQGQSLDKVREVRDQIKASVSQLLRELETS